MHPSARILMYLISALAIPGLSFFGLGCALGLALIGIRQRLGAVSRLLWRTRWLFLLLFLGYAYSQPGEALLMALGSVSPTLEGLWLGTTQGLHLLAILLLLDVLVLAMPRERQLAGLYGLLRPLAWLGVAAERTTLRLGLTLQGMERPIAERERLRDLFLDTDASDSGDLNFQLDLLPWTRRDGVFLLSGVLLLGGLWRFA
jgi:energy-coupling factor transporter transmembrane protein EcfT